MDYTPSSTITARDLGARPDHNGNAEWTAGGLRRVVDGLDGAPVVINLDKHTGYTAIGVVLVQVRDGGPGTSAQVLVRYTEGGQTWETWHLVFMLGETIVPLTRGDDGLAHKWTIRRALSDERSAAIAQVRADNPGSADWWGKWEATPLVHGMSVTYTPSTGNPAFADRWGEFRHWTV